MISYDIYLINYYSFEALLNRLIDLNLEIKKYYIYNDNYYLKIKRKYRNIIKKNFKDFKIVDKLGVINSVEKLILKPITCMCLFLSVAIFINLSMRVYRIDIKGDYPSIEKELFSFLKRENIELFSIVYREEKLDDIRVKLKEEFNDELEFIEILKRGNVISLNYKKRRKKLVIENKKGSLYASKDGVIRGFSVSSGVKNVKVYDFVKKGDLLVNEILITSNNESVNIGSIGSVYASTFYYIEVKCDLNLDIASRQAYLLNAARNKVSENLNSDKEYIESENILVNDINNGYMKIYYVLYEDITI